MSGTLSDGGIRNAVLAGLITIRPFNDFNVQPSSIDLTLAEELILFPGKFKLAHTAEWVELSDVIQGQVHGRSSVGRLGVLVHFTAGLIDPGFKGYITLECMAFDEPQTFFAGDRIAQLSFNWLDRAAEQPYAGRYQNQPGTVESRFRHGRD